MSSVTRTVVLEQKPEILDVTPEGQRTNIIARSGKLVEGLTATEGLVKHGFDYTLNKEQLFTKPPQEDLFQVPYYCVVRRIPGKTPVRIGSPVTERYVVSQNSDIATLADAIAKQEGWKIDAMGDVNSGTQFFVSLDAGESEVNGEPYHRYFILAERRGGRGSSLTVGFTPMRLQCSNAINVGVGKATVRLLIPHLRRFHATIQFLSKASGQLREAQEEVEQNLTLLSRKKLTVRELERMLNKTYPQSQEGKGPLKVFEGAEVGDDAFVARAKQNITYHQEIVTAERETTKKLYQVFGEQNPRLANTAYAFLMAVTELADHAVSRHGGKERSAISSLMGSRSLQKSRAYQSGIDLLAAA